MVLLLSQEYELSTEDVIDWLHYFKQNFIRVNQEDVISLLNISMDKNNKWVIKFSKNSESIELKKVKSYWYRRGRFNIFPSSIKTDDNNFNNTLNNQIRSEIESLHDFLHSTINHDLSIGSYLENNINKLSVLNAAQECGFQVPDTIIATTKKDALEFCRKHEGSIISKAISNGFNITLKGINFYTNTIPINQTKIKSFPLNYFPALFQERIAKKYELRIFYLEGRCYSSVIFSQNDPQTRVDFRNYNRKRPNRVCPYLLPKSVIKKIKTLMSKLEFKSGSLDVLISKKNEFIFLEVNPIGQFKQVSHPCNYNIEKIIALKLISPSSINR